jgi:hypothetical protein
MTAKCSLLISVVLCLSIKWPGAEFKSNYKEKPVKKTSIWCLVSFVIVALGCVALSVNLHAQGDTAQQIKELQQESRDAQMKNDASWAQQHLADGFVAGNSWGDWETKDDFIKDLQNKINKWKSGNISEVQVATFGSNIAVSHYTFTYDAELRGTHRARTVICSDTWINDSGSWKTAATHCSMVKGK